MTKEQKRQAEAAIFGLPPTRMDNNSTFTHEEIERMRAIIAQHEQGHKPMREFDINNPPHVPYHHQEFPRVMYHHGTGAHAKVHTEEQMQTALEAGYSIEAFPPDEVLNNEPELDEASAAEAAAIDARLKKPKTSKNK